MSQLISRFKNTLHSVNKRLKFPLQQKRFIPLTYQMSGLALNGVSRVSNEWAADMLSTMWFRVFKSKPKRWTTLFWQQAESCVELRLKDKSIAVSLWGEGPLVVMMHGWCGSGVQFRRLIPGLVAAGFQVAVFDAPAHGKNPGKQTHLLEFIDTLLAIQQQIAMIDTVMAHSLGGMAAVGAVSRGLSVRQLVLFGPHLDVREMYQSYSDLLKLNPALSHRFRDKIGKKMADIFEVSDIWSLFTPENLLLQLDCHGLLIYDKADEEISQHQFKSIEHHWRGCQVLVTEGLGHNHILRDKSVIESVLGFMGSPELI